MEPPKVANKQYKKIIPMRGNFAKLLKNELIKLAKNDVKTPENSVSENSNSNIEETVKPRAIETIKSPENKIIVHKVEAVKLETIPTSAEGKPRRISSFFQEIVKKEEDKQIVQFIEPSLGHDAIESTGQEILVDPKDLIEPGPSSSITLLSAKIPLNNCNNKVPLKVVRTIKQPKPKPNLRQRFHRVESFPNVSSTPVVEPDVKSSNEVVILSDIEMTEHPERKEIPSIKSEKEAQQSKKSDSDLEDSFAGFDESSSSPIHPQLEQWHQALSSGAQNKVQSNSYTISFDSFDDPTKKTHFVVTPDELETTPFQRKSKSKAPDENLIVRKKILKVSKASSSKAPVVNPAALKVTRAEVQKKTTLKKPPLTVEAQSINVFTPCSSKDAQKNVPSVSMQEAAKVVIRETSPTKVMGVEVKKTNDFITPTTSKKKSQPETLKVSSEMTDSGWQNDLLILIGAARIAELDVSLRHIPNIVTGNAIETENVELRLIIMHLLRKFKAKSVMDTLDNTAPMNSTHDEIEDSFDDDDDDFPDSFFEDSNDSNDFEPTTEDSVDTSAYENENCRNATESLPGPSALSLIKVEAIKPVAPFQQAMLEESYPMIVPELPIDEKDTMNASQGDIMITDSGILTQSPLKESFPDITEPEVLTELVKPRECQKRRKSPSPQLTQPIPKKIKASPSEATSKLVNGESRRSSLRTSSRETSIEPSNFSKVMIKNTCDNSISYLKQETSPAKVIKFVTHKAVQSTQKVESRRSSLRNSSAASGMSASENECDKLPKRQIGSESNKNNDSESDSTRKKILPKNLSVLLDGASRRNSLRSSSCESGSDATKTPEAKLKPVKKLKAIQNAGKVESRRTSLRNSSAASGLSASENECDKLPKRQIGSEPSKNKDRGSDSTKKKILSKNLSLLLDSASRRNSLRSSSCESVSDATKTPEAKTKPFKKLKAIQRLLDSDSDSGPRSSRHNSRAKPIQPLSDESKEDPPNKKKTEEDSSDYEKPLSKVRRLTKTNEKKGKISLKKVIPKTLRKIVSDSDSDQAPNDYDNSRNDELKSRLEQHDSNSKPKSSNLTRNDCLNSSDKPKRKGTTTQINEMMDKLTTTISIKKGIDPTYVTPPTIHKRERLRTSAFKGNTECSNDEDIQTHSDSDTRQPSVSRGSSVKSDTIHNVSKNRVLVDKRHFVQNPVQNAIEKLVPYNEILDSIKSMVPAKGGRAVRKSMTDYELKKATDLKGLKALRYFICGKCTFNVSKHEWKDHFIDHGGIAWIEGFEAPITFEDWNETLRRTIRNFKIYNITNIKCPNCELWKKSALGHLSHLIVCGEEEETVEERKIKCELCSEKYLPFNATYHKNRCRGLQQKIEEYNKGLEADVDDSSGDDKSKNDLITESFNSSGRRKRKAVTKAEKKFKQILQVMNKPSDHIKTVDGQLTCKICGDTDFESPKEASDHVTREHDNSGNGGDFEGSDSDASVKQIGSSDETEGSSGVESSDVDSFEDDGDSDNSLQPFSLNKKAKPSNNEPQEVKNGRTIMTDYVDIIKHNFNTAKSIQWTQQFINENLKNEVLEQLLPKYNISLNRDAKAMLERIGFKPKSNKFGTSKVDSYIVSFERKYKNDWQQLEIGQDRSDDSSATIYCGGSVSGLDWAPLNGDSEFLAVACNKNLNRFQMDLKESSKACVQLYEFSNLSNKNFKTFEKSSKLCYVIVINEGPVWSIKFHPSESSQERIGLLAVSTANQSVLVYSLPYLNNNKSIVLAIEPNIVCKLDSADIFFHEDYLLQATKIAWLHTEETGSVLAAGYINGYVAVWTIREDQIQKDEKTLYPVHVMQDHLERITALDFKPSNGSEFYLLTASIDRKTKVYTFNGNLYQEIASNYAQSRILCAEWWMHWPGFLIGFDDSFATLNFTYRQPLEFGMRNSMLLPQESSIIDMNINHWLNFAMFVTETGDVIGCRPDQMLQHYCKSKWSYFNFSVYGSTDFNKITADGPDEIGIVFDDFKTKTPQPKKFRLPPTDRINELQINQVCFNRNEQSYRFYAMGYETGFVRIRYLKNFK